MTLATQIGEFLGPGLLLVMVGVGIYLAREHARKKLYSRVCPHCHERMKGAAEVCPHCHMASLPWRWHEGRWWRWVGNRWEYLDVETRNWKTVTR